MTPAWALPALGVGAAASALAIEWGRSPVRDAQSDPDEEAVDEAAAHGGVAAQAS